jgi:hypothetical protein
MNLHGNKPFQPKDLLQQQQFNQNLNIIKILHQHILLQMMKKQIQIQMTVMMMMNILNQQNLELLQIFNHHLEKIFHQPVLVH